MRAESPSATELGAVERELADFGGEPLPADVVARLTRDIAGSMRFPRAPRRGPFRSLLLLFSLLLAMAGTASVGTRLHWPQEPARIATTALDTAFDDLADRDAPKENVQLAMAAVDRHVFQSLTTLKNLAASADRIGKTAGKVLEQLQVARQATPRPAACDVAALVAKATDGNAKLTDRLAAVHALGRCIAAGVTALQDAELQEEDLRIARGVYVRRLLRDIEKAATREAPATAPAASGSAPTAPGTAPSAR